MEISATEFKAKCLALIDQVHSTREPVLIRKRGKIVAKLLSENDPDDKPWLPLRGMGTLREPFEPAILGRDIEALR
jgi:antitoxin (DNA-binding transcriptional repressor) of toxin-antitoxin stability system